MSDIPDYINDICDSEEHVNTCRENKGFVCEIGDETVCIPETMTFIETADLCNVALDSIRRTLVDYILEHRLTNYDEFVELVRDNFDRVYLCCAYYDFEFYGAIFAKVLENVPVKS